MFFIFTDSYSTDRYEKFRLSSNCIDDSLIEQNYLDEWDLVINFSEDIKTKIKPFLKDNLGTNIQYIIESEEKIFVTTMHVQKPISAMEDRANEFMALALENFAVFSEFKTYSDAAIAQETLVTSRLECGKLEPSNNIENG